MTPKTGVEDKQSKMLWGMKQRAGFPLEEKPFVQTAPISHCCNELWEALHNATPRSQLPPAKSSL